MTLRQLARAIGDVFRSLRSIQQGINHIMGQIDDLKAADAAEASAVTAALAALKTLSDQHAADLTELAARTAANPDLSSLVTSINSRAAAITAGIATLHGTVSGATATGTAATDPVPVAEPAPAAAVTEPAADPAKAS